MFTYAIQNNVIITFINNFKQHSVDKRNSLKLHNNTNIFATNTISQYVLTPTESHFVCYKQHFSEDLTAQ